MSLKDERKAGRERRMLAAAVAALGEDYTYQLEPIEQVRRIASAFAEAKRKASGRYSDIGTCVATALWFVLEGGTIEMKLEELVPDSVMSTPYLCFGAVFSALDHLASAKVAMEEPCEMFGDRHGRRLLGMIPKSK